MNHQSHPTSPTENELAPAGAVWQLAGVMQDLSDADLDQPWAWGPHAEGIRFALLGTYQELRELAVRLAAERRITGPMTTAQHALAQYHAAYRDLQALLLGVDKQLLIQEPAAGEWPVLRTLGHIIGAERVFFTLVHYGLRSQRAENDLPQRLPDNEVERVLGAPETVRELLKHGDLHEIWLYFDALHGRALVEFAGMSEQEMQGPSLWWEDIRFPLQHRLHRFDAHLRQHTVQIENTLAALGHRPTEAQRLLRLVFNALAEIESFLIGAPDLALIDRQALAQKLQQRSAEIAGLLEQTRRLQTAVREGDVEAVKEILSSRPALVNAHDQQRLPLILTATYQRQSKIAALLLENGAELSMFEAAAVGDLAIVQREGQTLAQDINAYGRDGFTALQLACYFRHEAVARWLVAQGAELTAISRNDSRLQALHAAAASDSFAICRLLLEYGADANAQQTNGFAPLHAAAQHGNKALAGLLLDFGADPRLQNDQGQTAVDIARAAGHNELAAMLGN